MEELVVKAVVSGIMLGMVYALIGAGMNIVYGVMRVVNFAHGDFLMLAAYATYWFSVLLGWNPLISLLVVLPLFFVLGMVLYYWTVPRLLKSEDPEMASYLAYFGISLLISAAVFLGWGADPRGIASPFTPASVSIGFLHLPVGRLIAFAICVISALCLTFFLYKTYIGKAVRATIQNREAVQLLGINLHGISAISFGAGLALVGIAGALNTMIFPAIYPAMGPSYTTIAFAVIVLGGLGNPIGAVIGGLLFGLLQSISTLFIPAALSTALAFVILIVMVMVKPSGLMPISGSGRNG